MIRFTLRRRLKKTPRGFELAISYAGRQKPPRSINARSRTGPGGKENLRNYSRNFVPFSAENRLLRHRYMGIHFETLSARLGERLISLTVKFGERLIYFANRPRGHIRPDLYTHNAHVYLRACLPGKISSSIVLVAIHYKEISVLAERARSATKPQHTPESNSNPA